MWLNALLNSKQRSIKISLRPEREEAGSPGVILRLRVLIRLRHLQGWTAPCIKTYPIKASINRMRERLTICYATLSMGTPTSILIKGEDTPGC